MEHGVENYDEEGVSLALASKDPSSLAQVSPLQQDTATPRQLLR